MAHLELNKKKRKSRLVSVDVTHVSLVDRPANLTPFKFVKREDGAPNERETPMHIQLKNMFGSRKAVVTSVIATSGAMALSLAKMLLPEGAELETVEVDGVVQIRNAATPATEAEQVVHMGDELGVAYTVAHAQKELALYDMDSEDFNETIRKEGFVPGLMTGLDALHSTIRNIAMAEDTSSPEVFSTKVNKAMEGFSKYMDNLINGLPVNAFKFEKALVAVSPNQLQSPGAAPEGFNQEVYDAIFGEHAGGTTAEAAPEATPEGEAPKADAAPAVDGTVTPEAAKAAPADAATDPTTDVAEGAAEGGEETDASVAAADADPAPANLEELPKGPNDGTPAPDMAEAIAAALAEITKTIGEKVDGLATSVTALDTKVQSQVADLQKAVGGTVASTPEEDDTNVVDLSKANGTVSGEPPLMDTAYRGNRG